MQRISIKNSDIHIGESYKNLSEYLPKNRQIILITDQNLYAHYSEFISNYEHIIIGTGEEAKNWETVTKITHQLLEKNADRSTFLVGFGGGVVTDITGFVASIFMRGVEFGFVATSLLAQVDASLGGKNGINFQQYKNMLGVFNAPNFVICDAELLHTLPEREIRSGFGEIIKHALIKDERLFEYLQENCQKLLKLDKKAIEKVVWEAIHIKAKVVEQDWKEKGERKLLNFGHTVGHAIENNSTLTHGESVAAGMFWAANWSVTKGYLDGEQLPKIENLLKAFELPISHSVAAKTLAKFIEKDKKKQGTAIDFVFLRAIGEAFTAKVAVAELQNTLQN